MSKIKQAVEIIEKADRENTFPWWTSDPEVNFYVDMLLNGWEDIDEEEKEIYEAEATLVKATLVKV